MATLPKLGLRREALLFLPITALVLLAVSAFTLVAYRRAIDDLVAERRSEASARVGDLARRLDGQPLRDAALRDALGHGRGLAVLALDGLPLRTVGLLPEGNLLLPLGGAAPSGPTAIGPGLAGEPVVVGFAPLDLSGQPAVLRVDLEASILSSHLRSRRPLTWVVLGVDLALLLLLIQYLRHLLSPIDALLDRARALGPLERPDEDEIAFLVRSFDRALAAMSDAGDESNELGQLEQMLGGSMESGLLLLDRAGEVLALNQVGTELLGLGSAAEGRSMAEVLEPHPGLVAILERCLATGDGAQRAEVEIELDDGAHTLGLAVNPLRREDGSIRGWFSLFADLTEARREDRERQLSESLSRVGELTAGLAHELRNSLASIRGYLTLIERGSDDALRREDLREVRHEADHLHRVLQDFLSFARPGSAQLESVDLERLAHRAAADPALAGAAVRVVRTAEGPFPKVQGDPQLLERALRNLLHNAARAQAESSDTASEPIVVQLSTNEDAVVLEVIDQGPGIPDNLRDKLFVPFTSGHADGTGLGLALSRQIAELHHAQLTLENRKTGGVRATLRFEPGKSVTKGNNPVS